MLTEDFDGAMSTISGNIVGAMTSDRLCVCVNMCRSVSTALSRPGRRVLSLDKGLLSTTGIFFFFLSSFSSPYSVN